MVDRLTQPMGFQFEQSENKNNKLTFQTVKQKAKGLQGVFVAIPMLDEGEVPCFYCRLDGEQKIAVLAKTLQAGQRATGWSREEC